MVLGALLTAIVVVLQYLGQFIHIGPFAISLVLIPIVIGSAVCGKAVAAWLGFVFGIVVLITDAAAFLAVSIVGTVVTVILKGTLAGFVAAIVYSAFAKKNKFVATLLAAIVCPVVNTGVFLLGCFVFFFETIESWGLALGFGGAIEYMFFGLAGANFLVELLTNIVLSPVIVRLIELVPGASGGKRKA